MNFAAILRVALLATLTVARADTVPMVQRRRRCRRAIRNPDSMYRSSGNLRSGQFEGAEDRQSAGRRSARAA